MRQKFQIVIIVFLLLAFGILGYVLTVKRSDIKETDQYAVFLTNGQIYFGHLSLHRDFIVLKNVFYPQSNDFLRNDGTKKKITLQRLGNELHGPENTIHINKDQIMYFEKLRDDSKVNEAIKKYVDEGSSTPVSPSPSSTPTL
jgi:hypothetical protein